MFIVTPEQVAAEVPAYGNFVAGEVQRLGREHPLVKTQFFLETIDAAGRPLHRRPPRRHARQRTPPKTIPSPAASTPSSSTWAAPTKKPR